MNLTMAQLADPAFMEAAIAEIVRRIASRFHPDRVILFGSRARGEARPFSDVDLLVVMPVSRRDKARMEIEIGVAVEDIPVPKDIVVVSPAEVERFRDIPGTLLKPALRDGRVMYARG